MKKAGQKEEETFKRNPQFGISRGNVTDLLIRTRFQYYIQLIDVFSHRTNLNLVLEYLDSDLEMIIKDKSIVFMPADIKSWMMMTLKGLNHLHKSWILHRVGQILVFSVVETSR